MNHLETIKERILKAFSHAKVRIEPNPPKLGGILWATLGEHHGARQVVVEWRPWAGFGIIANREIHLSDWPDEIHKHVHPTILRVIELLKSGNRSNEIILNLQDGWSALQGQDPPAILAPATYFRNLKDIVVDIKGRRYKITFEQGYEEAWDVKGKRLYFIPTGEELTKPNDEGRSIVQLFGEPVWIQNPIHPLDLNGKNCYHFCTIQNGWGDSGNYNIMIGFDENDVPNVAYFEASCC